MNWLLVGVIFVLIFCTLKGFQRGFIRVIFSLVSYFLVIAFVVWAEPYISDYLEKNTEIYATIQQSCEEKLRMSAENAVEDQAQSETDELTTMGIILPEALQERLLGESVNAADELLQSTGVYTKMADTLAHFIISGISFFVALIVAQILLHIIYGLLNIVSHLPVIHGVNKTLGILAGFIEGLFYVGLFFYFITICCTSDFGRLMIQYIDESSFLGYIYQNNVLLQILIRFF